MAKETAQPVITTPTFTRKAQVTADVLKMEIDRPYFLQLLSAIEVSQAHESDDRRKKSNGQEMDPAFICRIKDLEIPGGPEMVLIVNAVLKGILEDNYIDKTTGEILYVGKAFEVTKRAKAQGKNYHTFQVYEVEVGA